MLTDFGGLLTPYGMRTIFMHDSTHGKKGTHMSEGLEGGKQYVQPKTPDIISGLAAINPREAVLPRLF